MRILILLAHPHPASFNHAIALTVCRTLAALKHDVIFHDLYAEKFDAILSWDEIKTTANSVNSVIAEHCQQLQTAQGIVIVHPNWWGQPPAILKGWIDRVLHPGVAYSFLPGDKGEGIPAGLLKAETALVFNTSDTPAEREQLVFGDPLEILWKNCIFNFCGIRHIERRMFRVIVTSSLPERQQWLQEVETLTRQAFPMKT